MQEGDVSVICDHDIAELSGVTSQSQYAVKSDRYGRSSKKISKYVRVSYSGGYPGITIEINWAAVPSYENVEE